MTEDPYKPTLYFYCYDHDRPNGGQRQTYRHVDILNSAGIDAYVLHRKANFRITWFVNATRIICEEDFRQRYREQYDIVVLPEDVGLRINEVPGIKVIFNKNLYSGYRALPLSNDLTDPYLSESVAGILTMSKHNCEHLRSAYPRKQIEVVHSELPEHIFSYRHWQAKKPQIVTIVSKAHRQTAVLFHILRARTAQGLNQGDRFKWIFVDNESLESFAQILRDSLIFVHLNVEEGLPESVLEAIASGCICLTYNCPPLSEYLDASNRFEYGQVIDLVKYIERLMAAFPEHGDQFEGLIKAQQRVLSDYSSKEQEAGVLHSWTQIIRRARAICQDLS
ncbi:MAG: glycosyltransferase [Terracidiphilus sp.]|jgi:hypothetical protein